MNIYLYKKTHNKTGLQYLGKTTKDPYKYKGSGKYWTNHLAIHGNDVTTEILKECSSLKELKFWGKHYSKIWNIVESKNWANLVPETGEGGGGKIGVPRSEETKLKIKRNKPDQSGIKNGMYGKTHTDLARAKCGISNKNKDIKTPEGKEAIRQNMKKQWEDPTYRQKMIENMKNRKGEKRSLKAIESYRKSASDRINSMTPLQRSEISHKAAETRRKKYKGLKRKRIFDNNGKIIYVYLPIDDTNQN